MKSTLDLVLQKLENMTADEIIEATNYNAEGASYELQLEGYEFYFPVDSVPVQRFQYNQVELKGAFKYELEPLKTYSDKIIGSYMRFEPIAA